MDWMPVVANVANSDASKSTAIAVVKTFPALLTIISLLVGIIVGIDQISRTTKTRHRIEWINKAVDGNASCEFRQQVLNELRLSQESAFVASLYVPWRKFVWLPLWAIGFGYIVIRFEIDNKLSKDSALLWATYFVGCLYFGWQSIGLSAERKWIKHLYVEGCFPELQNAIRKTHVGRATIALLYAVYPLSLCGGIVLSIDFKEAQAGLVVPLVLFGLSAFLTAVCWEERWGKRWPEYFDRKYADRWGVDTNWVMGDDAPSRPI
jgi:membrane protein